MIMTHTEEASTTFETKSPAGKMNGHAMASTENRHPKEVGSSSSSPSKGRQADETSGSSVLEMGSTDSAGGGSAPSCGLVSSLFPSSCRGRAEAFARRLHRRLTSLGGEDSSPEHSSDSSHPKETSWLHTPTGAKTITTGATSNHVLQRQPRHSPETDLYYDFDLDLDDDEPGSPAEEATAAELADLLVNTEILKSIHHESCHCSPGGPKSVDGNQDPESGCVFASPVTGTSPDSDSSDIYFDPESSDAEKPRSEVFFDPVTTSESEATPNLPNLSNGCTSGTAKSATCHKTLKTEPSALEDTSLSSCSSRKDSSLDTRVCQNDLACSSEDSLTGRSSLETTSPSHESLWSSFNDSTISLQDESPSRTSCNSLVPQNRLPKSHSDSEIPVKGGEIVATFELVRREEENECESDREETDFSNGWDLVKEECTDHAENDVSDVHQEVTEDTKQNIKQELSKNLLNVRSEESVASDTDTDHSTYSSTINIPGALTLECPTGERVVEATLKNEVKLQIENGTVLNGGDKEKLCLLLSGAERKLDGSPAREDVDFLDRESQQESVEEEEEDKPQRIRRCSSLKTGKTPPGTPGRKKIVRFADVLGLDLADVRTFLDEIPKVPTSAYSDLIYDDIFQKDTSPVNTTPNTWNTRYAERRGCVPTLGRKLDRTLVPLFQQPGGMPTFLDVVRERRVCLENVLVQDPVSLCIRGTIRVINLDFHKSVHIRYTLNSWKNFSDLQAVYVPNSCDGFSDKFSFVLYCHTLSVGQKLEFAVRFQCKGAQYWDNNDGVNYCFQCLPSSSSEYIPITSPENSQNSEWSSTFY